MTGRQLQPPPVPIIPPRVTVVPSYTTASLRDQHIQFIQKKERLDGQKARGYAKRALMETVKFR